MPVPVSPPAGDSLGESRHGENIRADTSLLKLPSRCRTRPSSPSATRRASASIAGKNLLSVPTPSTTPASRHASVARKASALVKLSGFSQNTAFPARAAATICSRCSECGVASTTVSIAGSPSTASSVRTVSTPCCAVNSRTRAGSRLIAWVKHSLSLLPCTAFTRVWPQRPSPTIAALIISWPRLCGYGATCHPPGLPNLIRQPSNGRVAMIEVWTWPTPNGQKVHIALEELGLPYKAIPVNIGAGDQFKPEFLKITPNHRIPAIVDSDGPGGKPFTLFESAAILIYLSEKTGGKLIPKDPIGRYKCLEWIMFQMGGIGPTFGQRNHFGAYAKETLPYGLERYTNEVERPTRAHTKRLEGTHRRAGDEHSTADIITLPWIRTAAQSGVRFAERGSIDVNEYPAVKRWYDELAARPAVQRSGSSARTYSLCRRGLVAL